MICIVIGEDSDYPSDRLHLFTKLDVDGRVLPDSAGDWAMVRDEVTGLIWEVKTNNGGIHDVDALFTWQAAHDNFIVQLNNENFGGYCDWRLPTVKELFTIAHKGNENPEDSAVDSAEINSSNGNMYWASAAYNGGALKAWRMKALDGDIYTHSKAEYQNAIAVRGEKKPPLLELNNDGTVTDHAIGLMWQQSEVKDGTEDVARGMTWYESLTYCEGLVLAGYDDWRLPNINELQSIVDYNVYDPSIDKTFFPEAIADNYWSSTTYIGKVDTAWNISFLKGDVYAYPFDKAGTAYVRAVRSVNPADNQ